MRRTPLKRYRPLYRRTALRPGHQALLRRTPLRRRSPRRDRLYEIRRELVEQILQERPRCEIRWDKNCSGRSQGIHEYIARSYQGQIVPGPKAEAQGQRFIAACHYCNGMASQETAEARRRGWLK